MAKTKISEFNANPALNTDIDSINIAEGCAPSGINDAIRELMSQLKDWQAGTSNDPMVIGSSGSLTLNQGTANGVAYLNGSKVVTSGSALVFDGTNLSVGTSSAGGSKLTVQNSSILVRTDGDFLKVNDVADTTYWFRFTRSSSDLEISNRQAGAIKFLTSDSEQMRLTSTGLGIGTSSPSFALDISQVAPRIRQVATTGTNSSLVQLVNTGGTAYFGLDNSSGGLSAAYALNVFHGGAYPIVFSTSGSERMRLDSSGNLGIGTTSPASKLHVVGNTRITADIESTGNSVIYSSNGSAAGTINAGIYLVGSDSSARFYTGNSERARIDSSGNLLVGTTAVSTSNLNGTAVRLYGGGSYLEVAHNNTATSGQDYAAFRYNGTQIGGITQSGTTAVAYNTSSDYRLKHDIAPMTGALAKVVALKPVTYKWNVDGSDGEGFIAHELAEVVPQCVTGEKDAVDAEGNPKYQGIDTSFLVATLTAAIQELNAKFEAYKASHP